MTSNVYLLGIAKVRRSLMVPIILFTIANMATRIHTFGARWIWLAPVYIVFDSALWIGMAFFIFAVIERRQKLPRQRRLEAMARATIGIATLAETLITVRALFESIVLRRPFVSRWLYYLPGGFYLATFYVAIVTGIGYAVYSWAVDERRMAEEAELDAAIARAELKAAASRLQPELLDPALARLAALMTTNPAAAQQLISDLGAMLHDSLAEPRRESRDRALTLQ